MGYILLLVCLSLFSQSPAQNTTYSPQERADLEVGSTKGYAILKAERQSVARGTTYFLDIEFHNTGEGRHFYNVFFNRGYPLAAQLAIFNSEKAYLGDLLHWRTIPQKNLDTSDWTYLPSGSYVEIKLSLVGANILSPKFGKSGHLLEAGSYYVQMIFYRAFVWPNFFGFDNRELFRSNVIQVQFVDI